MKTIMALSDSTKALEDALTYLEYNHPWNEDGIWTLKSCIREVRRIKKDISEAEATR